MITVLLVDDQESVRLGLRLRLMLEPDLHVVGEAGDTMRALALVEEHRPDVVVMDVEMDPIDGLMAAARIRKVAPRTAVVIHSMYDDAGTRQRAQASGVAAFIAKRDAAAGLPDAIRIASRSRSL